MKLKDIGEFGFIEKIASGCLIRPQNILKAVGDDAAAFTMRSDEVILLTTDMLVERVHFLRHATSGFNLGYKSLAVNLSDIAAMGGTAKEAFVSIAIPGNCSVEYLEDLYNGMKTLAREFDVNILGGDTTSSKTDLILNISLVGSVPENEILCRDAAQPGDIIFSTGCLGDSKAGLHLILNNIPTDSQELKSLFDAHILPKPCLREGRFLASQRGLHAAIDISDGLSSDLGHILKQSRVGARLYADKIPISANLRRFCERFAFNALEYALSGGEDYTLAGTLSRDRSEQIARDYFKTFEQPLYLIGEITDSGKAEIIFPDGQHHVMTASGWDHFKSEK